ncbi:8706_t:CDS:1, partial [Racocetra persica]
NGCSVDQIRGCDIIGRYKKLHFIVQCIFNQPCYMVRNKDVKEFDQALDKEPKEVIGFLVTNTYVASEVLKAFKNNQRILFCHENDLIGTIYKVEETNEQKLNILLGAFENIINVQKDILEIFKEMVDE